METRVCPQCDEDKPLHIEFSKHKGRPNGRASWCRACCKIAKSKTRERDNANAKIYRANNVEKRAVDNRRWQLANKDKKSINDAKHYIKYKDKIIKNATKHSETLGDVFIAGRLRIMGFGEKDITPDLIAYKRTSIQLHRTLIK